MTAGEAVAEYVERFKALCNTCKRPFEDMHTVEQLEEGLTRNIRTEMLNIQSMRRMSLATQGRAGDVNESFVEVAPGDHKYKTMEAVSLDACEAERTLIIK